jgi:hypothetical protein
MHTTKPQLDHRLEPVEPDQSSGPRIGLINRHKGTNGPLFITASATIL